MFAHTHTHSLSVCVCVQNPKEDVDPTEVQALLMNVKGLGGGLFVPDEAIDRMIRQEVFTHCSPRI